MTTQYIDPQIIFASDAPTQDKPPAFNNYVNGMDETRSNDGRPTIKQLNFIQQQNDFKFLYIHERGACLPFVEGFPYENNAIVFKDGLIQQKNGLSWVIPFMRGSQNLAELTDVAQARIKLDVYSKGEALSKENNLLDVSDKGVARTNLGVYSKAETDAIAGTPNATETVAGKAKIATTAVAQAGGNDTDFITPKKLNEVNKLLKGWFSTSGTTISGFGGSGITGVTRVSIGVYTISTSFDIQTNPVFLATVRAKSIAEWAGVIQLHPTILPTANSVTITTKASGTDTYIDYPYVCFGVF